MLVRRRQAWERQRVGLTIMFMHGVSSQGQSRKVHLVSKRCGSAFFYSRRFFLDAEASKVTDAEETAGWETSASLIIQMESKTPAVTLFQQKSKNVTTTLFSLSNVMYRLYNIKF